MTKRATQKQTETARRLRRDSTGPERVLWDVLRSRGLAGMKFRRQHPIDPYVVDFYCHDEQLVIELDGDSHDESRFEYDMRRQNKLESIGLTVVRISNDDVLTDMDSVVAAILKAVGRDVETGERWDEPSPQPSPRGRGSF